MNAANMKCYLHSMKDGSVTTMSTREFFDTEDICRSHGVHFVSWYDTNGEMHLHAFELLGGYIKVNGFLIKRHCKDVNTLKDAHTLVGEWLRYLYDATAKYTFAGFCI